MRWRGYRPTHNTWEPVPSFVPRIDTPFMEYLCMHKTKRQVSDVVALTRAIYAMSSLPNRWMERKSVRSSARPWHACSLPALLQCRFGGVVEMVRKI